jgi:hypothetical protein
MSEYLHTPNRQFWVGLEGELLFVVTVADKFDDKEWIGHLELYERFLKEAGKITRVMTFSPVGSPNGEQRKQHATWTEKLRFHEVGRIAFLSDSMLIRGTMTALKWLIGGPGKLKMFKGKEWEQALMWLKEEGARFELLPAREKVRAMILEATGKNDRWISSAG